MTTTINISIKHNVKICSKCNRSYAIVIGSDRSQVCPYCSNDFYTEDIMAAKKTNADLRHKIGMLERSNAALRGVITKLKRVEMKPEESVVEVDLSEFSNYIPSKSTRYSCSGCEYGANNENKCPGAKLYCYPDDIILVLKPEIKAALESGKAVAKGIEKSSSK